MLLNPQVTGFPNPTSSFAPANRYRGWVQRSSHQLKKTARAILRSTVPIEVLVRNSEFMIPRTLRQLQKLGSSAICAPERGSGGLRSTSPKRLVSAWVEAERAFSCGQYTFAVSLRTEILNTLYDSFELNHQNYSPPVLSRYYTAAIGHIGMLGMYSLAQEAGLVANSRRLVLYHRVANAEALDGLRARFELSRTPTPHWPAGPLDGLTGLEPELLVPSLWPIIERVSTIKTGSGFKDYYELAEATIGKMGGITKSNSAFRISEGSRQGLRTRLSKLGLSPDQPFVSLHIRESPRGDFRGSSHPSAYMPAIDALLQAGYAVVRFGHRSMTHLPARTGLIDLVKTNPNDNSLDYFVIVESALLVTNQSGPTEIARYAGTPVVVSNATAVGRNAISSPSGSVFIPKRYLDNSGREFSFSRLLDTPLAYSETMDLGPHTPSAEILNSAEEIRAGVLESIMRIEGARKTDPELQSKVSKIRDEHKSIAKGDISEEFVARNPTWLED